MWEAHPEEIRSGTRFTASHDDTPLSFRSLFRALAESAECRSWYTSVLASAPYDAFFWEHPPLTDSRLEQPAEWVLLDAPSLARVRPDPSPFEEHFSREPDSEVVTFSNLRGDAHLVVPAPSPAGASYPHLAAFLRSAPESHAHALWEAVATALIEAIGPQPKWLSTAGLGVHWLHLRIDSRPKYYRHRPYKTAA